MGISTKSIHEGISMPPLHVTGYSDVRATGDVQRGEGREGKWHWSARGGVSWNVRFGAMLTEFGAYGRMNFTYLQMERRGGRLGDARTRANGVGTYPPRSRARHLQKLAHLS